MPRCPATSLPTQSGAIMCKILCRLHQVPRISRGFPRPATSRTSGQRFRKSPALGAATSTSESRSLKKPLVTLRPTVQRSPTVTKIWCRNELHQVFAPSAVDVRRRIRTWRQFALLRAIHLSAGPTRSAEDVFDSWPAPRRRHAARIRDLCGFAGHCGSRLAA